MGRYRGQLQILCWTHNGSKGGSTHGGGGIGGVRMFGRMGRGEEKVLGVSNIKCAVQGLHCKVDSMDESSLNSCMIWTYHSLVQPHSKLS